MGTEQPIPGAYRSAPADSGGRATSMWPRHAGRENALPLTDAEAHRIRVVSFLTGEPVRLDLVLPCERCDWMPRNCTCGRPRLRPGPYRADADDATLMIAPARMVAAPAGRLRPLSLSRTPRPVRRDGGAA